MLYDVHGEIYGGVEYSQQAVYRADTENGRWRNRKWGGYGRVWDMKWQRKGFEDGEDTLLTGDHCTIGVVGKGAGKGFVQNSWRETSKCIAGVSLNINWKDRVF